MEDDKMIYNSDLLVKMREELAIEKQDYDPNDEIDKQFIAANERLTEALKAYIKVNFGEWALYNVDDDEEE